MWRHLAPPAWRSWPRPLRGALLAALYFGLAAASLLPNAAPGPDNGFGLGNDTDFALHMAAYAGVTVFTVLLVGRPLTAASAIFAYSIALELAQALVPARLCSLSDMLANAIGIGAGLAALALLAMFGDAMKTSGDGSDESGP